MPPSFHRLAFGSRSTTWWMVLALLWIGTALYAWHRLDHGWIPHDEGTLAQSAERVLGGQLPHRDFDEVYTGGLSLLDAAAFRVFGTNLFSLRLPLFGFFLLWVPAVYYIGTRFAHPAIAGLVAALGAAWSIPQYSAAMPTWYNLFFATFGTAALLRHLETGRRRWLVAAGLAGGLSCLAKIVGLYYVAAVLLFLVFRESQLDGPSAARPRWRAYPVAIGAALALFVALLFWLVHTQLAVPEIVQFVVPGAALAAFVAREAARCEAPLGRRMMRLLRLLAPFAAGMVIPLVVFLVPYIRSDSVAALWHGVFVAPFRRLDFAARGLPGSATLLGAVPVALLLGVLPPGRLPAWARRLGMGILLLALIAFLILSRHGVWYSIRPLLPLVVLVGVWLLVRRGGEEAVSPLRRQQVMLLLAVAALGSLVVFPFSRPIYFFYIAPLAALAVLAVVASRPLPVEGKTLAGATLALYLVFSVVDTHPSREPVQRLAFARGGLVVGARDAARYDSLVAIVRSHATGGYTYAAPDCPEVYFLAGLKNPTRTLWEFLADSAARTERVLRVLEDHHVTAVVIHRLAPFSGPLRPDLVDSLEARYPREDTLDLFTVRWRP
ncbi:MAG TPA: hypothetical protein VKP10_10400 [Gemmatimonadales bacterium]|nr:hypothetical protein [Gemmatimonadales bacterium]